MSEAEGETPEGSGTLDSAADVLKVEEEPEAAPSPTAAPAAAASKNGTTSSKKARRAGDNDTKAGAASRKRCARQHGPIFFGKPLFVGEKPTGR